MLPLPQIESLAAFRMNEQQIADVLNIDLVELKQNRELMGSFRDAMRKGRAKGEVELRRALFERARKGDAHAHNELMRLSASKD
ncbi:hypothetical protein [Pantoea sp.]|uniref:hypothetical protein n=1 Tax=Pantoea sp. TaxID=69393 RepID=UPI002580397C|nr:hypothetical protein [Pantoea sp.]